MTPGWGSAVFFGALIASIAIRVPHDRRSREVMIADSRKGRLERFLLGLVVLGGGLLPLLFVATPALSFADYAPLPWAFGAGVVVVVAWLCLFQRAHADLGTNWSLSLELRTEHRLITTGVFARVRHPMYAALFMHALAQLLLLSNWIAGPAMLVAFTLMFALRLRPEERMMRERFGAEYVAYTQRTKRLIPGVW